MASTYGNIHRFFLRSMLSRGVFTLDEAQEHLQSLAEEPVSLKQLVKAINAEIRPYQQTMKETTNEVTGEKVLVFLSLGNDKVTMAQTLFSATELEFFRLLLEEIMDADRRQISSIRALNVVSKMKGKFNKTDAEKLLSTWCRMYYLEKIDGDYALGVRGIHEFEGYFRQNMPDSIEDCCLCKQAVFRGCNCPSCKLAVHTRCLDHYLKKVQKWPCCKADYSSDQLAPNESTDRTQVLEETELSQVYDTVQDELGSREWLAEEAEVSQQVEDEISQESVPGISQTALRRKRRRE